MGTVTQEEKEKFTEIKERLRVQLEYQLTNCRFCFPFGRPEGALKSTLTLLEHLKVLKKEEKNMVTKVGRAVRTARKAKL